MQLSEINVNGYINLLEADRPIMIRTEKVDLFSCLVWQNLLMV